MHAVQVDSYEFADPKDIIPELKKDFWDGLASAKWSERKVRSEWLRSINPSPCQHYDTCMTCAALAASAAHTCQSVSHVGSQLAVVV
jgi:hypothetical protein